VPRRVRARGERAEVRARRVDQDPVVRSPLVDGGGVLGADGDVGGAHARRRAPQGLGPAGVALDRDDLAVTAHQSRQVGGLRAGRGAQVQDALTRLRVEQPPDGLGRARLRHELAGLPARVPERVERAVEDECLREVLDAARAELLRQPAGLGAQGVDAQRRLGGRVAGGEEAARGVRPERLPPEPGDPLGMGVRVGRVRGCVIGQLRQPRGRLAGRPPQHRVDQLRPAGRPALGELDGLPDGRVRRDLVHVDDLEEAEPQRSPRRPIEAIRRPPRKGLDQPVERPLALHRAVDQCGAERVLARIEQGPLGLGVERAIGPRVLLEDALQDRERRRPSVSDPRRSYMR
jgi:hypothetical protein